MKRRPFIGGLLTATLATGLLLVGSTSASAQDTEPAPAPPVFGKVQVTCGDDGVLVAAKLRNPGKTFQEYMVGIYADHIGYDYVVQLAAHESELVEFGDLPDNTYRLQAQNVEGDVVALVRVRVRCTVTPPTATSSATTAVPSTPVAVPTAVHAGVPGPAAQDDSAWAIVGGGLLATAGIVFGLGSLLAARRRGLHQGLHQD